MDKSRRRLLKGAIAAGGTATFAAGYSGPLIKMAKGLTGSAGEIPKHNIYGNALAPEYRVDLASGKITFNEEQRTAFTVCHGCNTKCGVRLRIENNTDQVLRSIGNPYHPLSADEHLDQTVPVKDALLSVSAHGPDAHQNRSTACARGNAAIAQLDSPSRVTSVLKRVGPRGAHRWESIPFEQAVEEICEGGDLFGEGPVEGLRAINDYQTLIDPENPEYGPKTNQLLVLEGSDYGREPMLKRFTFNAFGSINYASHGALCGLAMRVGSGAMMNDLNSYGHTKPDLANAKFAMFIGSAPSQAGNPFKRQGRQLADARTKGLDYVVIDPCLNASVVHSSKNGRWVPIRPGTDSALAMALTRWLLENNGYAADFLALPSQKAAEQADEAGHTNASHLVITQDNHPRQGHFLLKSDLGMTQAGAKDDGPVVWADGRAVGADDAERGELFVATTLTLTDNKLIEVASSLHMLRASAQKNTMAEYAAECGIPEATLVRLAERFAAAGRKAVVNSHGGMMSATGFHGTFGYQILHLLAGSINRTGGAAESGGTFNAYNGPRYDLANFKGMRKPKGVLMSRSRFAYEDTSEYRRKVAAGENPYPATAPWRKTSPSLMSEHLASGLNGYPYQVKALIGMMVNPLYAQPGLRDLIVDKLADPKKLGLFVSLDGFMNETNAYADYIIPDSVMYEMWGFMKPFTGVLTKTVTACWPVVEPRQVKTAEGEPVSMESFLIAVAKRLDLRGFGEDAIAAADGTLHPLNQAEDYYLRAAANIAFNDKPLPSASEDDIRHAGLDSLMPKIKAVLPENERGPVANLYSRGGRFQPFAEAYDGEKLGNRWTRTLCVYNEEIGTSIDSITGAQNSGVPEMRHAMMSDGTPMRNLFPVEDWPLLAFSFKSNLINSYTAGLDRLRMIKPYNPILVNVADAERVGVAHGDLIEVESPGGRVTGVALVSKGVVRGAVGIEHGFGHRELGAAQHFIDDVSYGGNQWIGAGVNLNDLGFADPTRQVAGTWLEPVTGAAVRQGLPTRIRKVAS